MSTTDFERLERLEQAITLCLQEIDHNFIRCHRVATACLPVVEQYAEQSRSVWQGAKVPDPCRRAILTKKQFWKQFFEAAAEVSVSGYEELAEPTDGGDITGSSLFTAEAETPEAHRRTRSNEENAHGEENMTFDNLSLADTSTPKIRHHKNSSKQIETPYQKIQHQIQQQYRMDSSDASISRPTMLDRYSAAENTNSDSTQDIESPLSVNSLNHPPSTPSSTPRQPLPQSTVKRRSPSKKQGPLLHRVLDNNWRIQATPIAKRSIYEDADVLSSPPAPEITSQIFSPSPMAKMLKTPLTQRKLALDDSDDDFEEELGMSPPVTMQFSMPASKLMRTPARTAAMNIVEEVLRTAGARDTTLDSIRTPGRPIGGRKLSSNASEREMWNAIRSAGTGGSSQNSSRRRVDVDLDGSPVVQKTRDDSMMMGGVDDRSTLMTMARLANGNEENTSLGDWQESEDWLH
jgi:DASH complex subunit ASK1